MTHVCNQQAVHISSWAFGWDVSETQHMHQLFPVASGSTFSGNCLLVHLCCSVVSCLRTYTCGTHASTPLVLGISTSAKPYVLPGVLEVYCVNFLIVPENGETGWYWCSCGKCIVNHLSTKIFCVHIVFLA